MISRTILLQMQSNKATFNLEEPLFWHTATLERCNLVNTNGSSSSYFIVHIEQMPREFRRYSDQVAQPKVHVGTFVVGNEPFNPQENHVIANSDPDLALQQLAVRIYNMDGTDATITTTFDLKLCLDSP